MPRKIFVYVFELDLQGSVRQLRYQFSFVKGNRHFLGFNNASNVETLLVNCLYNYALYFTLFLPAEVAEC